VKIANMLQFTEKHRFCVYRDFSLSSLDHTMLSAAYQPMVGGMAIALYHTLHAQLSPDKGGYTPFDQQRKLFLSLGLEQGERGRGLLAELATKLEAIGLLQTRRLYDAGDDDYAYVYILHRPLAPNDFFRTEHLVWLLHDKVGKHLLTQLQAELWAAPAPGMAELGSEDVSAAFYDLFRISPFSDDAELNRMMQEAAASHLSAPLDTHAADAGKYSLDQILQGITHFSDNRIAIERLADKPDNLYEINFVAAKYGLDLADVRWILDMPGIFDKASTLLRERFEEEARLLYLQREKRSDRRTVLTGQRDELVKSSGAADVTPSGGKSVDAAYHLDVPEMLQPKFADRGSYSHFLRNSGYTQVLEQFLPNGVVTPEMREAFLLFNTVYGLPDEALNVLIHYIKVDGRQWARFPIESIASDMNGKQATTYEAAVSYIRGRIKGRELAAAKGREASSRAGAGKPRAAGGKGAAAQKPRIPIAASGATGGKAAPSAAELEEMRKLARKLDEHFN